MRKLLFLLFVSYSFFLTSCNKNETTIPTNPTPLIGNWINPIRTDSVVAYAKAGVLQEDAYCFSFQVDQAFIERKNSGWCGTPPIVYSDFSGRWQQEGNHLTIQVGYWGGTVDYHWEVLSVTENLLILREDSAVYHMEL